MEEKANSESVATKSDHGLNFTQSRNQMLIIHGVRLGFQITVLLVTLIFQSAQPSFINLDVLIPVYVLLASSFLVHSIYFFFFERALSSWIPTTILFTFDAVFVTALIYSTGTSQSIFLFLYLVNIILAGFVFRRTGALALALWTAVLFSLLMVLQPGIKGQTFYYVFGVNILAFFAVAALSGYLSEQLNFMGHELSARRKDLENLRELNDLIVEHIATGLMTTSKDGRVVRVNLAAREILDRESRLLEMDVKSILPGVWERLKRLSDPDPEKPLDKIHFETFYRNAKDEKLTLEVIASPLKNRQNELNGFIFIFQDLTKLRRLEFAMRQSEKLAAVGQLAAGIAHEIRNPLASISGSIQLLKSGNQKPDSEEAHLMGIVLKEIDRLNNLISEFLEFVRPEVHTNKNVDLNSLLREIVEMTKLNQALRRDVEVNLDLRSSMPIGGHRDKLKQALLNIVINSFQAMEKVQTARLEVSSIDRGEAVIVRIRDSGIGMDENTLKRMFEPFHTTKPRGTGLGLAVTHKILEHHGVKVYVESSPGQGAEFTLEFPRFETKGEDSYDRPFLRKANE